jgi:ribosomal-protein-alanine N-acetyltransferase|uniref:[Ribosomal protein bS18]-alanine N-acetyltransferase n=1 Tax=candidate division WOR-3 bacterium TaxID=2052148 RepID=A0A7C3YTY3_UNCW3
MSEIQITRMTEEDLDEVMAIERESFKFPWKREFFCYDLSRKSAYCLVAKRAEEVVGYIIILQVLDEFHLANIAVKKEYRRQGIGSRLLAEMLKIAKANKIRNIFLEVRRSNLIAQRLYEKFGFHFSYVRKAYYEDGEDALVYEKRINNNDQSIA